MNTRIGLDVRKYDDFGIGTYIRHLLNGITQLELENPGRVPLFTLFHSRDSVIPDGPYAHKIITRHKRLPFQGSLPETEGLRLFHAPHYLTPDSGSVPLVLTVHDTIHLEPPVIPDNMPKQGKIRNRGFDHLKREYHKYLSKHRLIRLMERARHIITVSDWTKSCISSWVPGIESRTTRIHNCLDESYFSEISRDDVANFCREKGLPLKGYLVYSGNDLYHKNLGCIMAAWKSFSSDFLPPLMVLAGIPRKGMLRTMLEKMELTDAFRLMDHLSSEEMPLLYSGAKGFITSTLAEGFGLPVAEAMACGTPVICSNIPVLREVTGDYALFFNPIKPAELAERIEVLCRRPDRARRLGDSGRKYAAKYNLTDFTEAHLSVYNQVLGE